MMEGKVDAISHAQESLLLYQDVHLELALYLIAQLFVETDLSMAQNVTIMELEVAFLIVLDRMRDLIAQEDQHQVLQCVQQNVGMVKSLIQRFVIQKEKKDVSQIVRDHHTDILAHQEEQFVVRCVEMEL